MEQVIIKEEARELRSSIFTMWTYNQKTPFPANQEEGPHQEHNYADILSLDFQTTDL